MSKWLDCVNHACEKCKYYREPDGAYGEQCVWLIFKNPQGIDSFVRRKMLRVPCCPDWEEDEK